MQTRNRSQSLTREVNLIGTPASATNFQIKLPNFTPENPDLFLKIIDSILHNYKLNESELFLNLFINLPAGIQSASKHLLDSGAKNHISELKRIINSQYKLPLEDRIKKLFMSTSMGDLLPSQYLAHIQNILGEDAINHEGLIRNQFLAILPSSIAPFIQLFSKDCSLREIALAADKDPIYAQRTVNEVVTIPSAVEQRVHAIEEKFSSFNMQESYELANFKRDMDSQLSNLRQQLYETQNSIRDIQNSLRYDRRNDNMNRGKPHFRNRNNRSQSRDRAYHRQENGGLCYYHNRFKNNATRCQMPCTFNRQNQPTSAPINPGNAQ